MNGSEFWWTDDSLSLSYLQVLLGRLRPGPRVEGDETDGLQIERERETIN